MKNILIPTDFSDNSWNAIVYGLSFFRKIRCNFYLLHVSPYESAAAGISRQSGDTFFDQKPKFSVQERFQHLLKKIEKLPLNTKHQFFTIREYIFFVDSIRKQVDKKSIDFILMGTRGASGLKGKTVGSNTGDVITKVKCPILVIPEKARYTRPKEIVFPTDYHMYYKSKVLHSLTEVLKMNDAALRILHIAGKEKELTNLQKQHKDFLDSHLASDEITHSFHFLSNPSIEEALQCFIESREIDMITMIAKNLNFFQRILFHPTVEKISYHTEIPFLVLHE